MHVLTMSATQDIFCGMKRVCVCGLDAFCHSVGTVRKLLT
jgi:hypothetical protein